MIGLRDCLTLALTKLRTRRIRLGITLVVSGVLFAALVAASLVIRGSLTSIDNFGNDGLVKRFFVQIMLPYHVEYYDDTDYIGRALEIARERNKQQDAAAKRLGVAFDLKTAPQPTMQISDGGKERQQLSILDPAAQQALLELAPRQAAYKDVAKLIHGQGLREVHTSQFVSQNLLESGAIELTPVVNGAEVKPSDNPFSPTDKDGSLSTFGMTLQAYDEQMLQPFTLPGESLTSASGDPIPVIVPIDAAERLLTLKPLPDTASASQQRARLQEVRTGIRNRLMTVCYRNQAELDRRALARQYQQDLVTHKSDKTWVPPELIYAESRQSCQPVGVQSDKRNAESKKAAVAEEQFMREFSPKAAPLVSTISFRVVGVAPKASMTAEQPSTLGGLASSFLTSSLGPGWFVPTPSVNSQPLLRQATFSPLGAIMEGNMVYAEFPDRASQRAFIDAHNCTDLSSPNAQSTCAKKHRYVMHQYGNPLATLYDAAPVVTKWFQVLVLVVAALSAVVMMGTIGKIIADGRKETSVFRALGASRLDITAVYVFYTLILASLAFVFAVVLGATLAAYMEMRYSGVLSIQAVMAFNSSDLNKSFHLVGVNIGDMLLIYLFVLVAGLLAAAAPLLLNIRRNPIKDMREE